MNIPRWRDPNRRRKLKARYSDSDFVRYYDLDTEDFTRLVVKLKNNERLDELENDRYGLWILTISVIVLEGPKYKLKPRPEKEDIIEQQYFELLSKLHKFNEGSGSIFSYAYKIASNAAVHYYKHLTREHKHEAKIQEHLDQCMQDYLAEVGQGDPECQLSTSFQQTL